MRAIVRRGSCDRDADTTGEGTMRTQAEQIAAIRADQEFWRALAAEVGPARYAEPGPMGEWSFADMAGHLLGWRERTIGRVLALGRGEREPAPPWGVEAESEDAVDKVNDWIRERHAGRPPEQLVAEYDASYDRLIEALESVPAPLQTAVVDWADEPLVEVDFTGHLHDEHVGPVRAWLDQAPGSPPADGRLA
jgi:Mycothiol maleylpyruvate isomerase N-terminal domain